MGVIYRWPLTYFAEYIYKRHMYIAVYLRSHVSLLVNINIFYMTPQRATWKNSYYMLNVLPSLNKVLLLLLLLAQQSSLQVEKSCPKSALSIKSQKGLCNKPTKVQFQSILTRKMLMLAKRFESTEVDLIAHADRLCWLFARGHPRIYSVFVFSSKDHCDAHHEIDAFCEHLVLMRRR